MNNGVTECWGNGPATDKRLKTMVETLGTAVGRNVDFPPERLAGFTLPKKSKRNWGFDKRRKQS